MKKILINSAHIIAVISLITFLTTCKKDTDCHVIVTVKYYHDTTMVVPNADVIIAKGDVRAMGKSDPNGRFEHTFPLEAILDVYAEKDTAEQVYNPPPPALSGAAVVRLQPGRTVHKTVFIQ